MQVRIWNSLLYMHFGNMSNFCEDLGNCWSRTGQRQRCIVYLYCVSELETNSVWIFDTQPEAICFPKYHGPWYRFGFQASIHYYSILRCSNIQGFNTPGWHVLNIPGGIPLTSQPSWFASILGFPSRWNFYPNHTVDGSEIANNGIFIPPPVSSTKWVGSCAK